LIVSDVSFGSEIAIASAIYCAVFVHKSLRYRFLGAFTKCLH
jgi:hypothetical protein